MTTSPNQVAATVEVAATVGVARSAIEPPSNTNHRARATLAVDKTVHPETTEDIVTLKETTGMVLPLCIIITPDKAMSGGTAGKMMKSSCGSTVSGRGMRTEGREDQDPCPATILRTAEVITEVDHSRDIMVKGLLQLFVDHPNHHVDRSPSTEFIFPMDQTLTSLLQPVITRSVVLLLDQAVQLRTGM